MKIAALPKTEALCERFTVTLNGQPAPVAAARVSAMNYNWGWPGHQRPLDQTEIAGFVRCESNEPVEVCAVVKENVSEVCVRPLSKKIAVTEDSGKMTFTLPGPGQYVLEPNDWHEALHIFVAPEVELPAADTLYFGPGVHEIGLMELFDDQTVVLDAGAVVYGGFVAFGRKNITITGTGILDGSWEVRTSQTQLVSALGIWQDVSDRDYFLDNKQLRAYIEEHKVLNGCIRLHNCKNCTIEHITCRDSSTFTIVPAACENILIDDVKLIGMWRYNSDGVDYFNSKNCVLKNSFLRNFDDCVVLKGMCGWGHKNLENIITENCVVWCDWGRALEIGAETNADEYCNIIFRNCDVIHGSWLQLDIQHHNDAYIHDIIFDDIRCEYTRHQSGLKFQESEEQTYEEAKMLFEQPMLLGAFFMDMGLFGPGHSGQNVERIRFKNIQVIADEGIYMPKCGFEGFNTDNHVEDVVIENLTFNGKKLTEAGEANLQCNEFAWDIRLK
ncbi:MAG: hypothetical protein IKC46_14220 [Lachnospiraceae bacterium]|nr:hypothetical protein [Lachnospiraceae bacterium]